MVKQGKDKLRLSHSKVDVFTTCPMKYKWHYEDGWKPKIDSASLVFGSCVHKALEKYFSQKDCNLVKTFVDEWEAYRDKGLPYTRYDSWEGLLMKGTNLLNLFFGDYLDRFDLIFKSEGELFVEIAKDLNFIGYYDLICNLDGKKTIVDFKTAAWEYKDDKVAMSEQLTAYYMFGKKVMVDIEQVAFVVFLKKKNPEIQVLTSIRTEKDCDEYVDKLMTVRDLISSGKRYKNTSRCSDFGGCIYLPLCLGLDDKQIKEKLVKEI